MGPGILLGATGVGAIVGALTLASRTGVRGLGRFAAFSAAGFGASLVIFAFSRNFIFSMIVLVPVGFALMTQMACANTLIQSMVPDRLRGRMMALYSMMFMGMAPLGGLFSGVVADWIGAPWTVAIGGICVYRRGGNILSAIAGSSRGSRTADHGAGNGTGGEPAE